MPYVIRPKQRMSLVTALLSAALLAFLAVPAIADAACPVEPVSQPFERFGDFADYSLLSKGHFEAGTEGWSLNSAWTVAGNESFKVRSPWDSRSLRIDSTGTRGLAGLLRWYRAPVVSLLRPPGERFLGGPERQASLDGAGRQDARDDVRRTIGRRL